MGSKVLKISLSLLLTAALGIGGFLLYITLSDYKPEEIIQLKTENNPDRTIGQGRPFTVTTFNIGYAGLDSKQDFFMDGGESSRSSSLQQTQANLASISSFMKAAQSDFYLLQEVDVDSSRSYGINEASELAEALSDYSYAFAYNYKVPWVPVPIQRPMGSVHSGLLTLAAFKSSGSVRYDLPGKESWPRQQLDLDRAFIESRFTTNNGKELVLINLHLSAFDKGGKIRKLQLNYLASYLKREMNQGNYIIVGGDWNHALPGTDPEQFESTQDWPEWLQKFPETFKPSGFEWVIDSSIPTVRTLDVPYTEGVNFLAVIDGFLVSSNVEIIRNQAADLSFEYSDHNPVTAEFILN
ncbi:endonuclease/exonuclease/phosphatase family protein [Candidatus Pristimantibacillus sp. PTI5]|uniref:endonuclease/exonuclease/phosphatase family protein n=1 Tax=Candidatus Pristimantibacillus sp. PTI5 TaxID=3400422 RepID=UPI003B0281EA